MAGAARAAWPATFAALLTAAAGAPLGAQRAPEPPGVAAAWSPQACEAAPAAAGAAAAAASDADADGVDDRCEHALARAFAPELVVDARSCAWDAAARPERLGGAYLYAVQRPEGAGALRIAYLPAYYADCGWSGPKCLVAWRACRGHSGDSELIVVDAAFDASTGRWIATGVFLSAHCYGSSAGRCRWYRGRDLDAFRWAGGERGAPVVWVARGSHANYRTRRECDRGFWGYDTCDRNGARQRFPVLDPRQNAGSRARPFGGRADTSGCVRAAAIGLGGPLVDAAAAECIWRVRGAFQGWQAHPTGDPPTPYGRSLADWAGF